MTRLRTRLTGMALACAGLVATPPAKADPGSVAVVLSSFLAVETAVAVTVALYTYGAYVLTGYAIYGSIAARNKAKRAAAAARAAYNAGLQDRNITALTEAPGRRVVYGRADTGGDIVAMFTTDKTAHSLSGFRGGSVIKPDAYKHLIIVWAAHQCQAVNDLKIDGYPVGALDANGWATGDEWKKSDPKPTAYGQLVGTTRSYTLPAGSTIISVTLLTGVPSGPAEGGQAGAHTPVSSGAGGWSFSGTTLTLPNTVTVAGFAVTPGASDVWDISYSADDIDGTSCLRVRHHLGAPDQVADAELMALLPTKWTANHRLRGRCYSWITLDLERAQFQGGPPGITADISGALLLDPRTGATAWSDNPALCAYDYLRRVEGMAVTAAEVDTASVIAAANACDESTSFTVGTVTVTGPRYTCNGVFVAGAGKEAVLIDICEAMAGFHTYSGTWRVLAGSWTPPVMDLDDDDLHGSISIVQAGEPSGELFNTVKGQYVPAGSAVPAEIEIYRNATFVAADGKSLTTDIELPFTNSRARAKNISRIKVEQCRAGEVIFFPAKLRAWPLQTGDRVRVTSVEYGFSAKAYRVTDWAFGLRSPVGLTLQEDAPDIWDLADAAVADPTPNTDLPNPWRCDPVASVTASSGTAQLQRLGDGTIISRVRVAWPRTTAAYMEGGRIEVAWREAGSTVTHAVFADGTDTQVYLTGVRDGAFVIIEVTAINTQGARSSAVSLGHRVLGKSEAPGAVVGLAAAVIPGAVRISWTPSTELDYAKTLLRVGASWAAGTPLKLDGPASSYDWLWPALGSYTVWAAHVDTTGNVGAPVSVAVTVDSSVYIGAAQSLPSSGAALNQNPSCNDPSAWTLSGGTQPVFRQGVAGAPGGTCLSNASGAASEVLSDRFAIDPARRYKISILAARLDAGTAGRSYLGIAWYDADGALLHSGVVAPAGWSNGTYSYYGLVNQLPPAVFTAYELVFGPGTSAAIPSSAASARIVALLNLNAQAGAVHAISLARVENIDDAWAAQAAASAAQSTANGAATDASSALSTLATMRSNGYLDAAEKPVVIKAWNSINGEYAGIYNQGTTYGLAALRDAFATAYGNLGTYLNGLSPGWNDTTTDTPITPATDQATWAAYYSARQTLLNAIANETAKRANWDQVAGVTNFRVIAGGGSATSLPASGGLYVQGAVYSGLARSYTVTRIRRSDGAVTYDQAFDVYGTAGADAAMAAALNATDSSYIVVVRSYDEPQANRLTGGLAAAMYRCGASRAVFGSSQFRYRSAYVLVGIAGCGEGNGAEAYQGSVDADPNAWVDMAFQVVAGNLVGVTANFTPLSLQDYGYTGDLNATVGAPTGTYVAGQLAQDLVGTASTAASNASTALTNAGNALSTLATMRSNGYIDAAEKPALIKEYNAAYYETTDIQAKGTAYGLTALTAAYAGAYSALGTYLAGLSPSWSDTTTDTPITPSVDQAKWLDYYTTRQTLLNAIAEEAGKRAQWALVGGAGKPADNATRNYTYSQSGDPDSSPGGVVNGETWLQTSTGKTFVRVAGAWVPVVGAGSVNTNELTDHAAADWIVLIASNVSVTGLTGSPLGFFTDVHSYTYVPTANGIVTLTADHKVSCTASNGGSGSVYIFGGRTRFLVGTQQGELSDYGQFPDDTGSNLHEMSIIRSTQFAVTAGTTYTIKYQAQQAVFDQSTKFSGTLRIEGIWK